MSTFPWIVQSTLALIFLLHGVLFVAQPKSAQAMLQSLPFSARFVQWLGIAELLAAFGLIFPVALDVFSWLTPLAAIGLLPIIGGAIVFHFRRGEGAQGLVLMVLFATTWFVVITYRDLLAL